MTPEEQAAADAAAALQAKAVADKALADQAIAEAATKTLLTTLGVDSVEALTALLKSGTDAVEANKTEAQKAADRVKALETENATLKTSTAASEARVRDLTLQGDAEEVGTELKVSPAKSRQILKLLPTFDASAYDTEKGKVDLKTRFTTFLAEPENKHFIGTAAVATGSAHRPNSGGAEGQHPLAHLRRLVTAAPIVKK